MTFTRSLTRFACATLLAFPLTAHGQATEHPEYPDSIDGPTAFLARDCHETATTLGQDPAFCEALIGAVNPTPPVSYEDCVAEGTAFADGAYGAGLCNPEESAASCQNHWRTRARGFCNFVYPALGFASDSPIEGPNLYLRMSDGTLIAVNLQFPSNPESADPDDDDRFSSVLEMSGYESGSADGRTPAGDFDDMLRPGQTGLGSFPLQGGTRAAHDKFYREKYVSVTASVRGTGCSGGVFDLFSQTSAEDGREIIEWMGTQDWSNGKVGLFGHSYSGISATLIASTQPDHLVAISVSGLIGDLYRDIVYPGGVTNYGFPLLWTSGVRLLYDVGGGSFAGILADNGDRQCLRNQAARSRTVFDEPLIQGASDTDSEWFKQRSIVSWAHKIAVPVHVTAAYQDEQTGPRGPTNVFDHLTGAPAKRLFLTNGIHGTQTDDGLAVKERRAWLDHFLLGTANPYVDVDVNPVSSHVLLEARSYTDAPPSRGGEIESDGFPLGQTKWKDYFFAAGNALVEDAPAGGEATYFNGSHRQAYSYQLGVDNGSEFSTPYGPDELVFETEPFAADLVVAGPILVELELAALPLTEDLAANVDTEVMVQVIDAGDYDGQTWLTYLQRGLLRTSHRAIDPDPTRSQYFTDGDGDTRRYRPYRPHQTRDLASPGAPMLLEIDVFPVGHIFRAGHRLMVRIHAPSLDDNDYAYVPKTAPTLNTVHFGASRITLPLIPEDSSGLTRTNLADVQCASNRVRCVPLGPGPFAESGL